MRTIVDSEFALNGGIQELSFGEIEFVSGARGEWADLGPAVFGGMVGGAVSGAIAGGIGGAVGGPGGAVGGAGLGATAGAIGGGVGAVVTWYFTATKKK